MSVTRHRLKGGDVSLALTHIKPLGAMEGAVMRSCLVCKQQRLILFYPVVSECCVRMLCRNVVGMLRRNVACIGMLSECCVGMLCRNVVLECCVRMLCRNVGRPDLTWGVA